MTSGRGLVLLLLTSALGACGSDPTASASRAPSASDSSSTPSASSDASPSEPETSSDPSPSEEETPSAPPARRGTRVVADDSEFGPMLFDAVGQAIYLFDVETTSEPACYDACAAAWPPVLTAGDPVAGRGADAGLLGTTERRDGTVQVTYAGHPLYYYAHEGPGEVECHDVFLNGGNWYVVQPGGDPAPPA